MEERLATLVDELRQAVERARAMDPLLEVDVALAPEGRIGSYGALGRPHHVVRALYVSGAGESGVACQRDAAVWTEGGTPVRVCLDDVMDRTEVVEPTGDPAQRTAQAVDAIRSYILDLLPPG